MPEHGLFQSIADSLWSRSKPTNSPLVDECDQSPSLLLVQLRGCQFSIITTNLRFSGRRRWYVGSDGSSCVMYSNLIVNGVPIPAGSRIYAIEECIVLSGYWVDVWLLDYRIEPVLDFLYLLRSHGLFTIIFMPPGMSIPPPIISVIYDSYMYLLPDARSTNLKYRRSLILNHCRTIQLLFRSNSSLSLSRLLSSTDPEHLLVADRLLLQAVQSISSPSVL